MVVAVAYVFLTIGVPVISHYCGGELEDIAFFSKPTSCCGEEEGELEDGCCKNQTSHVAFQKDFTFYQLIKDVKAIELALTIFNFQWFLYNFNQVDESYISLNKEFQPPRLVQSNIVSCSVIRI